MDATKHWGNLRYQSARWIQLRWRSHHCIMRLSFGAPWGLGRCFLPGRCTIQFCTFSSLACLYPSSLMHCTSDTHKSGMVSLTHPLLHRFRKYSPATGVNYASFAIVGFVFNYLIKKKWRSWWTQYNYVLSAGLDSGVAIATVLIFLCVTYPGGKLEWWGNTVWKNTRDYKYSGYYTLAEGETFGPKTWSWWFLSYIFLSNK